MEGAWKSIYRFMEGYVRDCVKTRLLPLKVQFIKNGQRFSLAKLVEHHGKRVRVYC